MRPTRMVQRACHGKNTDKLAENDEGSRHEENCPFGFVGSMVFGAKGSYPRVAGLSAISRQKIAFGWVDRRSPRGGRFFAAMPLLSLLRKKGVNSWFFLGNSKQICN